MSIKKKILKPIIVIVSIGVVLGAGYLVKQYMFKDEGIKEITQKIPFVKKIIKREPEKKVEKKKEEKVPEKVPKDLIKERLGTQQPQQKVPVRVYRVSRVDYHDDLPVVGTIKSLPKVQLKFERNGVVKRVNYDEGDRVKKGNVIAVLDQTDAKLDVKWAKAKVRTAQAEVKTRKKRLETMEKLYNSGALIKSKLEEAQAQLEAAKRKVEQAEVEVESSKVKLKKTYLYAPRDGVLGKKEIEEGEFVTPNDRAFTLWDTDNLFAEVGVIEKDIGKIKRGKRARIIVDTYQQRGVKFWGVVSQIFPNIETKSRTLTIRIKITSSKAKKMLLPGMFARVKIYIYSKNNAIVVPDNAVNLQTRPSKISLIRNGKVVNKPISIDWVGTNYIVVKSGVTVGDTVVTETPGLKKLKQGTPVEIIETQKSIYEESS